MTETQIDAILKELSAAKTRRAQWEAVWELIAKYMTQRKQGFSSGSAGIAAGNFYTSEDVTDNTAGQALQTMVSSLDGALWKKGRTFRIVVPRQYKGGRQEVKDFYSEINARANEQIEHERSGWGTARQEALLEGSAFGTDAIGVFRNDKFGQPGNTNKLEYRALPLKNLYVFEDAQGRVYKEFYEFEFDAFQLVREYGEVARTPKVVAALDANNRDTKFKVCWVVRPREEFTGATEGVLSYSYESIHILEDDKIVVRQSGFNGNSIIVSRFYKNEGEEYGRSPGYTALSPTVELNALVEIITKGGELSILPSWYVLDDGTFGNGTIDRSPGGVIPIDATSSRITGMAPIGQIGTVGPLAPAMKLFEYLVNEVKAHFLNDKLTDLNNSTRMTLGEAQIRNELRSDNTGAIFSRQIDEKLTPVIRRSLAILEEDGELGVEAGSELDIKMLAAGKRPLLIPDEILELRDQGVEIYPIEFISPAARILRSEETRGMISLWQFAAGFSGVVPELLLWLDKKKTMPIVRDLYGAPPDAIVSEEEFEKALAAYQESQAAAAQMQQAQIAAEVGAKQGSAAQQNAQAEATRAGMNGLTNGGGNPYASMVM